MPGKLESSADAVLFTRVLHSLSDYEDQGYFLTKTLQDPHRILKPSGIVGVVQHMGPKTH